MSRDAYDLAAEQALLGAVLADADTAGPALLIVPRQAWWHPRHALVADLITDRLRRGGGVDPAIVLGDLLEHGGPHRETAGPWLHGLYANAFNPKMALDHATRVRELHGRRQLTEAAIRLQQRLEQGWEAGDTEDVHGLVEQMREACTAAEDATVADQPEPPMTLAELLAEQDTHDWLVPGLLERAERMILTGAEGLGKSMLACQLACCLAAGVHPFTGAVLGAGNYEQRVLVVDLENSLPQTRRRYRRIRTAVDQARTDMGWGPSSWADVMRVEVRPAGVNLLDAREAAWLERVVSATAPDVLVIGPLYRLHTANINDETAARELVAVLDGIRVRHRCALLTEAHAGHAEDGRGLRKMRPTGSSLFMRWPEFGFGLRRSQDSEGEHPSRVDVIAWRGSREERSWPQQLRHGGPAELPWVPLEYRPELGVA